MTNELAFLRRKLADAQARGDEQSVYELRRRIASAQYKHDLIRGKK